MSQFFANVPVWVWPLFLILLLVGLNSTRTRTAPIQLFYALPFLGLLSLRPISTMHSLTPALAGFALAYLAGAALGFAKQSYWVEEKTAKRVTIKGEWMTLATMMGLFALNFLNGAINGMAPELAQGTLYALFFGTCAGLMSGTFIGRAMRVITLPSAT